MGGAGAGGCETAMMLCGAMCFFDKGRESIFWGPGNLGERFIGECSKKRSSPDWPRGGPVVDGPGFKTHSGPFAAGSG